MSSHLASPDTLDKVVNKTTFLSDQAKYALPGLGMASHLNSWAFIAVPSNAPRAVFPGLALPCPIFGGIDETALCPRSDMGDDFPHGLGTR